MCSVTTMLFDSSSCWLNHSGHITQSVFSASWDEFIPLNGTSAGLLSLGQYLQLSTGRRLLVSLTLLCTDCFHFLSMPLIQQSATSESLQHEIFLIGTSHFRASSMAVTSLANMTAAKSSILGIVWLLRGATLVLDATNFTYVREAYELGGKQQRHMPLRKHHKIHKDCSRPFHSMVSWNSTSQPEGAKNSEDLQPAYPTSLLIGLSSKSAPLQQRSWKRTLNYTITGHMKPIGS